MVNATRHIIARAGKSLTLKLSLAFGLITLLTIGIFADHIIKVQKSEHTENLARTASLLSDTVIRSTRGAMLGYEPKNIETIIETVGKLDNIAKLRIFNKEGLIKYSSNPDEIGRMVDMESEQCYACHAADHPLVKLNRDARTRFFQSEGVSMVGMITPIYNEEQCWTACHDHPQEKNILGVLDVDVSMREVDERVDRQIRWTILFGGIVFLGISALSMVTLFFLVNRPIKKVVQGAEAMARGDRVSPLIVLTGDEFSDLARAFNEMSDKVRQREKSLREALAKNAGIITTASDAIITFDRDDWQITSVNPAAVEIFGRGREELLGQPVWSLLDRKNHQSTLERLLSGGRIETIGCRNGGTLFPIEAVVAEAELEENSFFVGMFRDISGRKETERSLIASEAKYRSVFENTGTASVIVEEDGLITLANTGFEELSGRLKEEIEGVARFSDFFLSEDVPRVMENIGSHRRTQGQALGVYEARFLGGKGIKRQVLVFDSLIPGTGRSVVSILDLTDLRRAEEKLSTQRAYFRQLFRNSPQAIVMVDVDGIIIDVNPGFENLFGYTAEEAKGRPNTEITVMQDQAEEITAHNRAVFNGRTIKQETQRRRKDGSSIPVLMLGLPIYVASRVDGAYFIFNDISELKAIQEELAHQAFHDSLTGLPNRILLMERLGRAAARAERRVDYFYAVMLIDLDRFKMVNDGLGHLAGDKLLIDIAHSLRFCVRAMDTVARLGGDEFAILLEDYKEPKEVINVAKRIQNAIRGPFILENQEIFASASIGIVLKTNRYRNPTDLLRDADTAMYRAKESGRSRFKVFNPQMHEKAVESLRMENELRKAMDNNELQLFYQPILDARGRTLECLEALVRWNHPTDGLIPPARFIPLAEETGLIIPLGKWVIHEACRQLKLWRTNIPGAENLSVNVNVSSKQLRQADLVGFVSQVLDETDIPPEALKLEITESVVMGDEKAVLDRLHQLKSLGVDLAIDDFGTGYSSLAYLLRLPIDCLKIDRTFINGLIGSNYGMNIVRTICGLAKDMGLTVVAEGVEKEEQLEKLIQIGCTKVQGYLFSRPVDRIAAAEMLKGNPIAPRKKNNLPTAS